MQPLYFILVYCALVVLSSLLGGWLPSLMRLTHTRIQLLMSLVGGLMLGIGVFHLLPHAVNVQVPVDRAVWWMMIGLLTTFLLIRVFHAHEHAPPELDEVLDHKHDDSETAVPNADPSPGHEACGHDLHSHHHHHGHHHGSQGSARYRWVGIALGLSLHTLLDGVALSASVLADSEHMPNGVFIGFAAFLGILLHKPLDSLSITALMAASGWSARFQQIVNFGYALMCPIGALIFYFGVRQSPDQAVFIGCALAFSAGIFVCIALGDLLPELQFHSHDRLKLTAMLLLGVAWPTASDTWNQRMSMASRPSNRQTNIMVTVTKPRKPRLDATAGQPGMQPLPLLSARILPTRLADFPRNASA